MWPESQPFTVLNQASFLARLPKDKRKIFVQLIAVFLSSKNYLKRHIGNVLYYCKGNKLCLCDRYTAVIWQKNTERDIEKWSGTELLSNHKGTVILFSETKFLRLLTKNLNFPQF